MIVRRMCTVSLVAMLVMVASSQAFETTDTTYAVSIENPTVKIGERAVVVATISAREGFRITESYRHRIMRLTAPNDGLDIGRKVVRGSVQDGRVVFRFDVVPKTAGAHMVVGIFRFSINNGQQLDIKAAPFEAIVTATE